MKTFTNYLKGLTKDPILVLDPQLPLHAYTPLDLSMGNTEIEELAITNPDVCQRYIDTVLQRSKALVAYGGYLEVRNLYNDKDAFTGSREELRNIHLGIDFWCPAGTAVLVPIQGRVHSFRNNSTPGDYGPAIILEHSLGERVFYTLYGHLSLASLDGLYKGKVFKKGEQLATLGTPDINVHYAPHLHFQIILDLQGHVGDYPGVATQKTLAFFKKNCPDPNLLLKIDPVYPD